MVKSMYVCMYVCMYVSIYAAISNVEGNIVYTVGRNMVFGLPTAQK